MSTNDTKQALKDLHQSVRKAISGKDLERARDAMNRALELVVTDGVPMSLHLLHADVLRAEGKIEDAKTTLRGAAEDEPDNPWPHYYLASYTQQSGGDPADIQASLDQALELDRDKNRIKALPVFAARFEHAQGRNDTAIARLEAFHSVNDGTTQSKLLLASYYRLAGRSDDEAQIFTELATVVPEDHQLLRALFEHHSKKATGQELETVIAYLRQRNQSELASELRMATLIQSAQYEEALEAMRQSPMSRRGETQAYRLGLTLWGAQKYRLAIRYLRFCLRRWPSHSGIVSLYVRRLMKLGDLEGAEKVLNSSKGLLPERVLLSHQLILHGYRGEMRDATACLKRLKDLNCVNSENYNTHTKLMFNLAALEDAEEIFATVGHLRDWDPRPLHRLGLAGMFALEFDLERREVSDLQIENTRDWVRLRPQSPMAAIRFIDAWRATTGDELVSKDDPLSGKIPNKVFQYWDTSVLPPAYEKMVNSWRDAPGFEHQLFDRSAAREFLRGSFGPKWVRAFQLASSPAMESDFVRLCLLAKFGGVYSDADDYLYGDLNSLLIGGTGRLVLYRESLGGALANNFMAAPAEHPVVVYAAHRACLALLERSVELAWTKTGPGLLTCAVGQYLLKAGPKEAHRRIKILEWQRYAQTVVAHNMVPKKLNAGHWEKTLSRQEVFAPWKALIANLPTG